MAHHRRYYYYYYYYWHIITTTTTTTTITTTTTYTTYLPKLRHTHRTEEGGKEIGTTTRHSSRTTVFLSLAISGRDNANTTFAGAC